MKLRLTKAEKNWILYDVGNSVFVLLSATLLPIYFNSIAADAGLNDAQYLAFWGYAASAATLAVALLGPALGALADTKGYKQPIFRLTILAGACGCAALGFARQWLVFLAIYVIAKVGFSASLIFYDSMLSDVTEPERMDQVSSHGYAWGYIGSCIPFALCLGLVLGAERIGLTMTAAIMLVVAVAVAAPAALVPAEVFCGTTAPRGGREFPPLGAHPGECETGKEYFFVFVGILFLYRRRVHHY